MSTVAEVLQEAGVHRALIVDDAYDAVPKAADLALEGEEWNIFFEDLGPEENSLLGEIFPLSQTLRPDELIATDPFVATLWEHRHRFRGEIIGPLFSKYTTNTQLDQNYLKTLEGRLHEFGLRCETAGRDFEGKAGESDLLVIDLFLGVAQDDDAVRTAIDGLTRVITTRQQKPPLVILMSRSSRLEDKRQEFRDKSGLFESAFRIIRKAELADPGKLQRILLRLAGHYRDSLKLIRFHRAWHDGLSLARDRTSLSIRSLDLADHAQIRQLLLSVISEPTGSYLVDVFDRVLRHEVECEKAIIDAAIDLNSLTCDDYPPPYFAGSPDLQNLVYRSLFQGPERLQLSGPPDSKIAFGDVLRRKASTTSENSSPSEPEIPLNELTADDVLVVLTPACDLQRQGAKRVMLLVGSLQVLTPTTWKYKPTPIRTTVFESSDKQRFWIKWDLKNIVTLTHNELDAAFAAPRGFQTIARLRESHALELQQKLLSDMGRVGLVTALPATFPMRVEVFVPDPERKLVRVEVPKLDETGGVYYVGRNGESDISMRLVLCEDACEAICEAVSSIELTRVHSDAHEALRSANANGTLMQVLERGVALPKPETKSFKEIVGSPRTVGDANNSRTIGWIARNIEPIEFKGGDVKKAGVVICTWDADLNGAAAATP